MASNEEMRNSIAGSDLDLAIVTTKDYPFARLHQSHADAVVRDVNRVVNASTDRISLLVAAMMTASLPALVGLCELNITIHALSWLPKGVSELLLEIYKKVSKFVEEISEILSI